MAKARKEHTIATGSDMGLRIRSERLRLELTQDQLAKRVGCTGANVSHWEHGNVMNIRGPRLFALADALGVTARWLVLGGSRKNRRVGDHLSDEVLALAERIQRMPEERRNALLALFFDTANHRAPDRAVNPQK